jgi:PAS domain S-box-containing protein
MSRIQTSGRRVVDKSYSNTEAERKTPLNEKWKLKARSRSPKGEFRSLKTKSEALPKSNKKFPTTWESQPELICRFIPDGTLTFVNQALAEWIGQSPEALIGQDLFQYIPVVERDRVRKEVAALSRENPVVKIEDEVLNPRGEMSLMHWIDTAICGKDGQMVEIQGVGRDMTDFIRMQDSLDRSERRFQHLLESMNEGFSQVDENLVLIYVNPRICEMLGYEREELVGKPLSMLLDEKNEKILRHQFEKRKRGEAGSYEVAWKKKSGENIQVILSATPQFDDKGVFRGSHAVSTDITRLKQAEQALKERERELNTKTTELSEANAALKTLLKVRDESIREIREDIVSSVEHTIMPHLRKLEKGLAEEQKGYLKIIKSNLDRLVSPLAGNSASKFEDLTPAEMKVAGLVRDGNTSEQIASELNVSRKTVEFHRHNIRKKLGVKSNLRGYLATRRFPGIL